MRKVLALVLVAVTLVGAGCGMGDEPLQGRDEFKLKEAEDKRQQAIKEGKGSAIGDFTLDR